MIKLPHRRIFQGFTAVLAAMFLFGNYGFTSAEAALNLQKEQAESLKITAVKNVKLSSQDTNQYHGRLNSLHFIDQNNGWAIRTEENNDASLLYTKIIETHDRGIHWSEFSVKGAVFKYLQFIDKTNGWAIAQEGNKDIEDGKAAVYEILSTKDGGKSWNVQLKKQFKFSDTYDMYFQNAKHGYAIINGFLYSTVDGGCKWSNTNYQMKNFTAQHITFSDSNNGWVIGYTKTLKKLKSKKTVADNHLYVLYTTDGGNSWKQQFKKSYSDTTVGGIDITFFNSKTGWFLTSNLDTWEGELYYTSDAGMNWKCINKIKCVRPTPKELDFVSLKKGWIPLDVGAGPISGGLMYTKDGGKHFRTICNENEMYSISEVEAVTAEDIWAINNNVNDKDYIIHSTDGGKSWLQTYPAISSGKKIVIK